MKFKLILLSIVCGTVLAAALSTATQPTGAPNITPAITPHVTIDGGTRRSIPFPHQKHVDILDDCNVCHDLYPTTAGIIATMKKQGKLKKKSVMNGQCTKCHRARKKAGEPSGPTKCSTCHAR